MPEEGRDQEIYEAETKYEIMISTMSCFWDKNQNREIILEVSVLNGDVVVLRFLLFSLLLTSSSPTYVKTIPKKQSQIKKYIIFSARSYIG